MASERSRQGIKSGEIRNLLQIDQSPVNPVVHPGQFIEQLTSIFRNGRVVNCCPPIEMKRSLERRNAPPAIGIVMPEPDDIETVERITRPWLQLVSLYLV